MNRIQNMDRYTVLSELKKYVNNTEETMKGTAVSTLNKDIFDMPNVNKTTELHQMKVGKSIVNIPIVKEEKVSDKIDNATLSLLLSKIKNADDREVIKEYIKQQNIQDIKNVVAKKSKVLEGEVLEGEDEEYSKMKKDIQEKLRAVKTREDLNKVIDEQNINDFREKLKSKGFKILSSGLTKTLNATKERISDMEDKQKRADEKKAEDERMKKEKTLREKEEKDSKKKKDAEREKAIKRVEAEEKARLAKIAKDKADKEAEEKAKAKSKSDAQKVGKGAVEDIIEGVMKQIGKSEKGKEKQDKGKEKQDKEKDAKLKSLRETRELLEEK